LDSVLESVRERVRLEPEVLAKEKDVTNQSDGNVTMIVCGDIGPNREPVEPHLDYVMPYLQQGDIRFAQCEAVYSEEGSREDQPRYARAHHPSLAKIYTHGGYNAVCLASNHTQDYREIGVLHNIETFKKMGIQPFGTGATIHEARQPLVLDKKGVKSVFLGYCSVFRTLNDEATDNKPGCNPMRVHTWYEPAEVQAATPPRVLSLPYEEDLNAMVESIKKAKQENDLVFMCIHWGVHNIPKVIAQYQPIVAHAAIDAGADMVIGTHTHNPKAIEVYKGKVIFYSLSNFVYPGPGAGAGPGGPLLARFGLPGNYDYRMPAFQVDQVRSCIVRVNLNKDGVQRVAFMPALVNDKLQPEPLKPSDPRFQDQYDYWDWVSEGFNHNFRIEGDEVVIEGAKE
jgi:poly-gamma-glutamate synthesis protein (capsule biosynthesis protein)